MNDKPMIQFNAHKELVHRLTRIESKLARGFEELGVNTNNDREWITVDDQARVVYMSTLGRSLMVTLSDMVLRGATHIGKDYELVHQGKSVATVVFNPPFSQP